MTSFNGKSFASDLLNKLSSYILRLQDKLYERYMETIKSVNLSPDSQIYETMTKIMSN